MEGNIFEQDPFQKNMKDIFETLYYFKDFTLPCLIWFIKFIDNLNG